MSCPEKTGAGDSAGVVRARPRLIRWTSSVEEDGPARSAGGAAGGGARPAAAERVGDPVPGIAGRVLGLLPRQPRVGLGRLSALPEVGFRLVPGAVGVSGPRFPAVAVGRRIVGVVAMRPVVI